MTLLQYILWLVIGIGIVIIVFVSFNGIFAQTPDKTPAPPVQLPTPVSTPTPTSPNPNLQYLPQKAYVQAYAPENGIPLNSQPLQIVPQVVPAPVQNNSNILDQFGGTAGVMAMLASAGIYLKTRVLDKKTEKNAEVTREQSAQIVKGAEVDQKIADRVYKNMSDGGASINDAPEIKLETLAANKEEAVKTATKA